MQKDWDSSTEQYYYLFHVSGVWKSRVYHYYTYSP